MMSLDNGSAVWAAVIDDLKKGTSVPVSDYVSVVQRLRDKIAMKDKLEFELHAALKSTGEVVDYILKSYTYLFAAVIICGWK